MELIEKYETFDELTNPMLLELVDKVLVHERDRKGSIQTTQEIEIYFNFIGRYIPPDFIKEPTEEELEEMRKIEAKKDRLHQAYLRRKESGWQAEYEAKVKAKRNAGRSCRRRQRKKVFIVNFKLRNEPASCILSLVLY